MKTEQATAATPSENLPLYRLLTGPDDATFCKCVSEMTALGYKHHGSPSVTSNGQAAIAAQALVWPRVCATQEECR